MTSAHRVGATAIVALLATSLAAGGCAATAEDISSYAPSELTTPPAVASEGEPSLGSCAVRDTTVVGEFSVVCRATAGAASDAFAPPFVDVGVGTTHQLDSSTSGEVTLLASARTDQFPMTVHVVVQARSGASGTSGAALTRNITVSPGEAPVPIQAPWGFIDVKIQTPLAHVLCKTAAYEIQVAGWELMSVGGLPSASASFLLASSGQPGSKRLPMPASTVPTTCQDLAAHTSWSAGLVAGSYTVSAGGISRDRD
jgi:hypothetical protein